MRKSLFCGILILVAVLTIAGASFGAGDGCCVDKQDTWQETLRLAREKARDAAPKPAANAAKPDPRAAKAIARANRNVLPVETRIWNEVAMQFPEPAAHQQMLWEQADRIWTADWANLRDLAMRYARNTRGPLAPKAMALAKTATDVPALSAVRDLYYRARAAETNAADLKEFNFKALRLAIEDLGKTFGDRYPKAAEYLKRLDELEKTQPADDDQRSALVKQLQALRQEALLGNPLLDFDKLLLVRRRVNSAHLGLPANWQSDSSLPRTGFENDIAYLSPVAPGGKITSIYNGGSGKFTGDLRLHFNADRILFSSVDAKTRYQVYELNLNGGAPRQLTGEQPDVDSYDACYLPNGKIIFTSTACFAGVPCVFGSSHVANLYVMDEDGKNIRQLTVDQEHDWCPTMLNNGRVMYLRWEYTDTPHSNTRLLFSMNPDGTDQMQMYKSNSYWPNGIFFAKPIPNDPTKVVGIISGHHGVPRMGELVIFDPAKGTHEADGVVQRIPGYGKNVEPIVRDALVNASWPKFLHPYPLSDKYFIVSAQMNPQSSWGVYLVDIYDNMLLLAESPGNALLEPIPLKKTARPPVLHDRVDPSRHDATVYINDVCEGKGMKGVPHSAVKQLRIFTYHFAYQGMGGLLGVLGVNGPWDPRRVLGTVPVEADGSAYFRVPANTPISIQPLDADGKALAIMRSWATAAPGETLSCVGCHEDQNNSPPNQKGVAASRDPSEINPWYGPTRGFNYAREVQPVVDHYCVGCHDGKARADGTTPPDFRGTEMIKNFRMATSGNGGGHGGKYTVGYANLARYVRRPGEESDYHTLMPLEYHADTTALVQTLQKGHYGVQLDREAWDRLITWIDLNAPFHGTWTEVVGNVTQQHDRRRDLRKLYAGIDEDPEAILPATYKPGPFVMPPQPRQEPAIAVQAAGWPFDAAEAARRQASAAAGGSVMQSIDLGDGIKMELVLVPAGEFVMGDPAGYADERPLTKVRIDRPFWVGKCEISNAQFHRFDPSHDSHVESKQGYQFGIHGYPVDQPQQPVVRLSWHKAMAFCQWLSARTGQKFSLPTEAQWEYACRAGTASPLSYGDLNADFSKFANVADKKLASFASNPYTMDQPLVNPTEFDDYVPKDIRFDDGGLVTVAIGNYKPNAWGLCDMHGNAAEWTRTTYRAYPYNAADGRDAGDPQGRKVVRGGSWRDRPRDCRSGCRLSYEPWQGVFNVGFRVICEAPATARITVAHGSKSN